jgi:hypothetical protein
MKKLMIESGDEVVLILLEGGKGRGKQMNNFLEGGRGNNEREEENDKMISQYG